MDKDKKMMNKIRIPIKRQKLQKGTKKKIWNLNTTAKMIKTLKRKYRYNICDLGSSNGFLGVTYKL